MRSCGQTITVWKTTNVQNCHAQPMYSLGLELESASSPSGSEYFQHDVTNVRWSKGPGVRYYYGSDVKYKARHWGLETRSATRIYSYWLILDSNSNSNGCVGWAWRFCTFVVLHTIMVLTIRVHVYLIIVEDKLGRSFRQNLTINLMCGCDSYFGQSDSWCKPVWQLVWKWFLYACLFDIQILCHPILSPLEFHRLEAKPHTVQEGCNTTKHWQVKHRSSWWTCRLATFPAQGGHSVVSISD